MPHVFVSYMRPDRDAVERLIRPLRAAGIQVWIDYEQLGPGQRWQRVIQDAIRSGYGFLACFSSHYTDRPSTYMNEELNVAIEELRKRADDSAWFMPITFDDSKVPEREIRSGQLLGSIQATKLGADWDRGVRSLIKAIQALSPPAPKDSGAARPEVVVLDVGGTNLRAVRVRGGEFVNRGHRLTKEFVDDPDALADEIASLARSTGDSPVYGVATSGIVKNGSVYSRNLNLTWFPLAEALEKRLNRPIAVFNDVRAAAWGEFKRGAGQGTRNMMFLTISTGIGAGFVLNEQPYLSPSGLAGEFGQMLTDIGVPIEDLASGRAIEQRAPELRLRKAKDVHDRAMNGDKAALSRVRPGLEAIARNIANVRVLLGIERVVLGGSIGRRENVVKAIKDYVAKLEDLYAVEIEASRLEDDAGLEGVADLVLQGQLI